MELVIAKTDAGLIRLRDIADVELTAAREKIRARLNGENTAAMAIETTPTANPLEVTAKIKELLPSIEANLPSGMKMQITYDATEYIEDSINEVSSTIIESSLIVILVIFAFMANPRAMMIPVVTIPFSLVGVCLLMEMFGFSINLMTLLAMVLAIGMVVDDAIVVVENVERHIREGKNPFDAAIQGTREITTPVISTTVVLAAVFVPIATLGGLTGALFKEFALTLVCAVVVSSVIALTLSPVMCSLFLKKIETKNSFMTTVESMLDKIDNRYARLLNKTINNSGAVLLFVLCVIVSIPLLNSYIKSELAPVEDKGGFLVMNNAHSSVNLDYVDDYVTEVSKRILDIDGVQSTLSLSGIPSNSSAFTIALEEPIDERGISMQEIIDRPKSSTKDIAGVKTAIFPFPALPGTSLGFPIQFVVQSNSSYQDIYKIAKSIEDKLKSSSLFITTKLDLSYDAAKVVIDVNRQKANMYSVSMKDIASTLAILLGDGHTNVDGYSYEVIPQVTRSDRLNPEEIGQYHVVSDTGVNVPLSNLIEFRTSGNTQGLNQLNQVNSVTISAVPMPTVSIGDAISHIEQDVIPTLPKGYTFDWKGESRQLIQEGNAIVYAMLLALVIVYLVLAIQFECWRVPLVVMLTVPLATSGALVFQAWGFASMNIYTQIGLLTLIGLITKNGILMCEVAQVKQQEGLDKKNAILDAARLRLRAILMTAISMVAGVIPLIIASGAGAGARQSIGIVLGAGMTIGTLFTLFVLPTLYLFIVKDKHKTQHH